MAKISVFLNTFPLVSETFVLNHITALIDTGQDVSIIALNEGNTQILHHNYTKYQLNQRLHTQNKKFKFRLFSVLYTCYCTILCLIKQPKAFLNILKHPKFEKKLAHFRSIKFVHIINSSDIIHAHFGTAANRIALLKEVGLIKKQIPLITSIHGYDIQSPDLFKNQKYYQALLKYGNHFIANSSHTKNKLVATGFREEKITIQGVTVDTAYFKFNHAKQQQDKCFNILTVARLVDFKGLSYSIQAIKLLVEKGVKNIAYNIIGDGPLKDGLTKQIEDLELTKIVKLLGAKTQSQIKEFYQKADVFVLPSTITQEGRTEAQGLVLQEAQAMQIPVIASNVGGIADGMIDQKTGFLVSDKSPNAIAEKIEILMNNPALAKTMGQAGRTYIMANFDSKTTTLQLLNTYQKLIDQSKLRSNLPNEL